IHSFIVANSYAISYCLLVVLLYKFLRCLHLLALSADSRYYQSLATALLSQSPPIYQPWGASCDTPVHAFSQMLAHSYENCSLFAPILHIRGRSHDILSVYYLSCSIPYIPPCIVHFSIAQAIYSICTLYT